MRTTENKRNKIQMPAGIRQKMMAAVSMLMVSSIMLVSSTYAWFTLSTAPEVAGITTSIGSNGNLEMLLLSGELDATGTATGSYYNTNDDLGVVSAEGQSMASSSAVEANEFWGNLVDLNDPSYGLGAMSLAPSRLNVTKVADSTQVGTTILNAPTYGSDGRVIDVKTATYNGKYNGTAFAYDEVNKGVRVIGTTTDVSQRTAAYRTAKANVTTYISAAKSDATASLMNNGQNLANILVGYAVDPATKYDNADLDVLKAVLISLQSANANAATAIKNAVLAENLSSANTAELTDQDVATLKTNIEGITISATSFDSYIKPAGLDAAVTKYLSVNADITTALSKLEGVRTEAGEYTFNDISGVLNNIIDKSQVEIGGKKDLSKDNISDVISYYTANGNISMKMLSGSGVYADIAELVGNYTVSGLKVHVNYSGINADVPIIMSTGVSGEGIPYITSIVIGAAADEKGQAANSILSNMYGYALDFGFRTNASSSDLLLQTDAANRVYSDSAESSIQGAGSYMQFTSHDIANFTAQDVLNLMSAVRVAFVDVTSSSLIGMGALDIERSFDNNTGVWTYSAGDSAEQIKADGSAVAAGETAAGYKAGLYLYDHTVNEDCSITLGAKKTEAKITALTQNKASKITVVVYLDGDLVDNTMVANSDMSLVGKLNLQFSSSAALTPMENTGMREGGATAKPTAYTKIAEAGQTYSYGGYSGTVKEGYTIYDGGNGSYYYSTDASTYIRLTVTNFTTPFESVVAPETSEPEA